MPSDDTSQFSQERFRALAAAVQGEDIDAIRCPNCDVHYLDEAQPGIWECDRCGRVENPRSEIDANCPYCGLRDLTLYWEEAIIECPSCGVVDKEDVRAIVDP